MKPKPNRLLAGLLLLTVLAGGGLWLVTQSSQHEAHLAPVERSRLGLLSTLPIYWGEATGIDEMLQSDSEPPWVRSRLERRYDLEPLDTLDGLKESGLQRLLLAQPRALSASENVALDQWVRGGGHVLVLADPMLTGESRFGIGDRRRPQDVVLLSPIFARWGLELRYDPEQPTGERMVAVKEAVVPANQSGQFAQAREASDDPGDCELAGEGLMATCSIGQGRAVLLADAALLEDTPGQPLEVRLAALDSLTGKAFE